MEQTVKAIDECLDYSVTPQRPECLRTPACARPTTVLVQEIDQLAIAQSTSAVIP